MRASLVAANARQADRDILRSSVFVKWFSGSNISLGIDAAIRQGNLLYESAVSFETPDTPANRFFHDVAVSAPRGVTIPKKRRDENSTKYCTDKKYIEFIKFFTYSSHDYSPSLAFIIMAIQSSLAND